MLDTISAVVDAAVVSNDVDAFALHEIKPGAVLEPRTADEAAAIMRLASEHNWRVECAGAGTQAFGNRRTRADIIVSTRKLNRVSEYDAADLVIGAQAGMTLHELQRTVHANSQFLAQDPFAHERSTIGGVIATARSGPTRFAYGTPRDHVLGLQAVTGDGRVLNVGGRVVKNVAGYDLVRLLVGSAGTLALITSAYLRLRPLPQTDETVLLLAAEPKPLLEIAAFIAEENLEAVALELVSPGVLRNEWTLMVRLCGNHESVGDARARVQARTALLRVAVQQGRRSEWYTLEQMELNTLTSVRLADLPTRIGATLQLAQNLAAKVGPDAFIAAHAGDGIVRLNIKNGDVEATAFAIGEVRTILAMNGGTVVVHSRTGELMRRVDAYGGAGNTLPLMAKLKQLFDPASVLAPGRFVV